jgi:hypothetical protein
MNEMKNKVNIAIFFSIAVFLFKIPMMMAQYIPNNSEEINFIFSNNGETANI